MKIKKSIGVTLFGGYLIVSGFLGFLNAALVHRYDSLLVKQAEVFLNTYPNLKNLGLSPLQGVDTLKLVTQHLFAERPIFLILTLIVLPALFFLVFLAGLGILRLKERWRMTTLFVVPLLMAIKLIIYIYFMNELFKKILLAALLGGELNLYAKIDRLYLSFSDLFVEEFVRNSVLACVTIFYFTRPKVKKQFKKQLLNSR